MKALKFTQKPWYRWTLLAIAATNTLYSCVTLNMLGATGWFITVLLFLVIWAEDEAEKSKWQ